MKTNPNTTIEQADDGRFAVVVDGEVIRDDFVSRGHAAMYAARKGIYKRKTPPPRPKVIPANLEDECIRPIPLLAKMSGQGYPGFLKAAKAGEFGELYQLGNGFGLKYGNWKRGMSARVVKPTA